LTARACAECGLPAQRFAEADARWLWPEDPDVTARLYRLGLATFGQVATLPETVLVHQFGRTGRLLYRRARGRDLTPVRALYPPLRADARLDLSEYPVENQQTLEAALVQVAAAAARQLRSLNRHGRRIVLRIQAERKGRQEPDELRRERVLSTPMQAEADVVRVARGLLAQADLAGPVVALRLLVEDLETPVARTGDLFDNQGTGGKAALLALRRTLVARYGPGSLTTLGQHPLSARDQRHVLLRERHTTAQQP
jgi:hypothetical protein